MIRKGRKTREWEATRRKLKKDFEAKGITFCEKCGSTFGLSFAHSKKRRFITNQDDLETVALLCIPCHENIEHSADMETQILSIINQRLCQQFN